MLYISYRTLLLKRVKYKKKGRFDMENDKNCKDNFSQIIKFKIDSEEANNISQICSSLKKQNLIS